jgi:hypothetical protein
MSFCYEETAEAVDGGAVGIGGGHVAPAQPQEFLARPPCLGLPPHAFRSPCLASAVAGRCVCQPHAGIVGCGLSPKPC